MSERRERIPAEEVPDPKRWKLPYWTEPQHVIHVDEEEESDDSDVLVEEEEIEVEPLTADQLEAIRQEAYNEGLEQGLIEGRQKGEKQGHDAGHAEGLVAGKEEGKKIGYDEGLAKGEKAALAEGEDKSAQLTSRIQSNMRHIEKSITEQRASLEKILPELVISLSEAVVSEELSQGSEHIVHLVNQVLDALPTDTQGLTIECNSLDLPFLEAAQENSDFEAKFKTIEGIQPGGCKVKSQFSSIDFTLSERWQSVLNQYQQQLQLGFNNLEEIQKTHAEEIEQANLAQESTEQTSTEQEAAVEERIEEEGVEEEGVEAEKAEALDKSDSIINEAPTKENDEKDVEVEEESTAPIETLDAQQESSEQEIENQSTADDVGESNLETPDENSEVAASQEVKDGVEPFEQVETDLAPNSDSSAEDDSEIENKDCSSDDDSILEASSQEREQLDERQGEEDDRDTDQNDPVAPGDTDE